MRKVNFQTILSVTLLVFVFLLASSGIGKAQNGVAVSATQELYGVPKVTFVDGTQAEALLNTHVMALKAYLETLPQGSPAYLATYRATAFYRTIWYSVKNGDKVEDAFIAGLNMFASVYFQGASYSEKLGLRQEAIEMLSVPTVPKSDTY